MNRRVSATKAKTILAFLAQLFSIKLDISCFRF